MKKTVTLVLVVLAVLVGVACDDSKPAVASSTREIKVETGTSPAYTTRMISGNLWAIPSGMDLEQFPIMGRKLTQDDQIRLGLRLAQTEEEQVLLNEDRRTHAFRADVVRMGTKVWVDRYGDVRYIESCGNRAEAPVPQVVCPRSVTCKGPHPDAEAGEVLATAVVDDNTKAGGSWSLNWLGDAVRWLLGLALLLALGILLGWLLYRLFRWMMEWATLPVVTPVMPVPPMSPVVQPLPVVVPHTPRVPPIPPVVVPVAPVAPVRTTRHYGPFKAVEVEDRGVAGYRVLGDNSEIGVFTGRVTTEDAGRDGHYVVVTT